MGGIVPKKLRLFKRQQVIFFNKRGDSPLKGRIGKVDARNQYFVEGFDQESFPAEAASEMGKAGFSLFVWGIGSTGGGTVPERGVSSSLDESLLSSVAAAAGGAYYGSGDPLWRLGTEYRLKRRANSSHATSVVVWHEGAWWLLWPGLLCIVAEMSIGLSLLMKKRRRA